MRSNSTKIIIHESELRRIVQMLLLESTIQKNQQILEIYPSVGLGLGLYGYNPKEKSENPEEKEKKERREQIAKGQIPVGVKLAIETDGEPMAVKVGYATYMGSKMPIGIVYSKVKNSFNPIGKYGSLVPVDYIVDGIWEYPDRFAPVTDRLAQAGNKHTIKKLKEEEVDLDVVFANAPALKKKVEDGDAQAFYSVSKMFVLNETKGTWFPPTMKSTAAGIERSQSYKCAMSKREFGKAILDFGSGAYLEYVNLKTGGLLGYLAEKEKFYGEEELDKVAPCFAAVADSLVYDMAAAILGAMVGAVASPAAGTGTYATLQIAPMVPVLMWHIQKKNWQSVIFYIVRMVAAVYGGASTQVVKQIVAAVVELLASLASEMGYSFSAAEQGIVLSWFEGKTISQAEALAAQINTNDPLGLVSLYPNL